MYGGLVYMVYTPTYVYDILMCNTSIAMANRHIANWPNIRIYWPQWLLVSRGAGGIWGAIPHHIGSPDINGAC